MRWTRTGLFGIAIALGVAGSAIAGSIVIRAEGPSKVQFPAGKSLGARVTLVRGDKLVVRLARGDTLVVLYERDTRTLRGPATFDLAARGSTISALRR